MRLRPDDSITTEDLRRGQAALVRDAAWASLAGSLYGGVILVGFALALGAGPFLFGVLAAIPFIGQAAQLPAIAMIEHVRQRRKITFFAVTSARVLIASLAALPFVALGEERVRLLLVAQLAITILGSIGGCSLNSWLHQLLPREGLGAFFARRLFWATTLSCVGSLAAGLLVDHWPYADKLRAYSVTFAIAALAGFASSYFITRVPEPPMTSAGPQASIVTKILMPFRDTGFRSVLLYIFSWNVASNFAAPFLAVFLMQQLHFSLGTVTQLWVVSQVANAVVLYIWGRLSDRFSNKAVLAVAVPAYFLCVLGLVFAALPQRDDVRLGIFYAVHIAMGAASGGIGLATGNMSLKLAPQGQGTAYLAATSLVASVSGGIAPILGGALAQLFETAQVSVLVRWAWPGSVGEATVIEFAHWQFLFLISVALGMYVLHALSRIREGEEVSERVVMQQFALEALRTVNQLSTVAGLLGNLFAFNRLIERRLSRRRSANKAGTGASAHASTGSPHPNPPHATPTQEPAVERRTTSDRRAPN